MAEQTSAPCSRWLRQSGRRAMRWHGRRNEVRGDRPGDREKGIFPAQIQCFLRNISELIRAIFCHWTRKHTDAESLGPTNTSRNVDLLDQAHLTHQLRRLLVGFLPTLHRPPLGYRDGQHTLGDILKRRRNQFSQANLRLGYQPSLSHLAGPKYLVYTTPEAAKSAISATTPATALRQIRFTVAPPLLRALSADAFVRYHFGCFLYERRDKSVESIEALVVLFSDAASRSSRSAENLRLFIFADIQFLYFLSAEEGQTDLLKSSGGGNISSAGRVAGPWFRSGRGVPHPTRCTGCQEPKRAAEKNPGPGSVGTAAATSVSPGVAIGRGTVHLPDRDLYQSAGICAPSVLCCPILADPSRDTHIIIPGMTWLCEVRDAWKNLLEGPTEAALWILPPIPYPIAASRHRRNAKGTLVDFQRPTSGPIGSSSTSQTPHMHASREYKAPVK